VKNVAENKKYVELLWAGKYNKIDLSEKMPIEKPNLPFQTIEQKISLHLCSNFIRHNL